MNINKKLHSLRRTRANVPPSRSTGSNVRIVNSSKSYAHSNIPSTIELSKTSLKTKKELKKEKKSTKAVSTIRSLPKSNTTVQVPIAPTKQEETESSNKESLEETRLSALEELFPASFLKECKQSTGSIKSQDDKTHIYDLLVQSLYAIEDDSELLVPEKMNLKQLDELIVKTQSEMQDLEQILQAKERQRARLLRWWEVKHGMLSILFKCKSELKDHDQSSENPSNLS